MSNIYIQEPPTSGKVLLETSVGDIDIELWAREAPKACRNFVQLCLEGYYNGTIFHRIVKGFIAQGGDPTGTGTGGDSIYGAPFKDEFHSRLRFVRRGLVAMANAGKDDNGSQFFFTLGACPELQNKHTVFGKVTGDTLYNILKLEECIVDIDDRPRYPHKITKAKVLQNPFPDIIPREIKKEDGEKKSDRKSGSKATKNFKLLSFGDEAEEDEEEVNEISKGYRGRSKSSHDLTDDPRLSSVPAVGENVPGDKRPLDVDETLSDETKKEQLDHVKKRLKKDKDKTEVAPEATLEKTSAEKTEEIRKEVNKLKKELSQARRKDEVAAAKKIEEAAAAPPIDPSTEEKKLDEEVGLSAIVEPAPEKRTVAKSPTEIASVERFSKETEEYRARKKHQKKKGSEREAQTMALLAKFQAKLHSAREKFSKEDEQTEVSAKAPPSAPKMEEKELEEEEDEDESKWLAHTLHFETHEAKVKDANMNDEDTFEIFDPRNPINQRRREASKQAMRNKQR